jgi:hypothetical protein
LGCRFHFQVCTAVGICYAQDLAPRAYVITPLRSNAITLTWLSTTGTLTTTAHFPSAAPQEGTSRDFQLLPFVQLLWTVGQCCRLVALRAGSFEGTASGADQRLYRSGLLDSTFRFSVNLKGGPAMPVQKFRKWHQKMLLGASLKVIAPTGQYDPTKLINWGANRWGFKPEFGYSQRWAKWVLDGYMGVWLFTGNNDFWSHNSFYPGTRSQSQSPIGSFEGHLSYDFKPRLWASLDGNFWFGGNYQSVSAAWQYSWLGKPK